MKNYLRKIITKRVYNVIIISALNLVFLLIIIIAARLLFMYGFKEKHFLLLIILILVPTLPILNFALKKINSLISPMSFGNLYFKTIDSILNMESFEEILYKAFDSVIVVLNAGFAHIIFYETETEVYEIEYKNNKTHEAFYREKTAEDQVLINSITGPDDIITKTKCVQGDYKDKRLINIFETSGIDIIVPIHYNNRTFGIIALGMKKSFPERDIKFLKMIAFKLAILSVNNYYFGQIRKRKEVEKEYELTNKIQKQFLPEPSVINDNIIIKAYYDTASSFTREFYDIFINNDHGRDIRISAYRVQGDVKETFIIMPGVQAMLQSYARLGFSPEKSLIKLTNLIEERDVLNGELEILHSSINRSGEFICCCSGYPMPFYYQRSSNELSRLTGQEQKIKCLNLKIKNGDIIIITCNYYYNIISENIFEYSEILQKNYSQDTDNIKEKLITKLNDNSFPEISATEHTEKFKSEDKLLILITMEDKR